jgi:hypothetical protein
VQILYQDGGVVRPDGRCLDRYREANHRRYDDVRVDRDVDGDRKRQRLSRWQHFGHLKIELALTEPLLYRQLLTPLLLC